MLEAVSKKHRDEKDYYFFIVRVLIKLTPHRWISVMARALLLLNHSRKLRIIDSESLNTYILAQNTQFSVVVAPRRQQTQNVRWNPGINLIQSFQME